MLSLVMAYRSFERFRRASTRFDTPPCSGRHHPVSAIAPFLANDRTLADPEVVKVELRGRILLRIINSSS
ncbi:MAG TPA: hypothetical protein VF699_01195, partial [Caulobacteraceae bacterium]